MTPSYRWLLFLMASNTTPVAGFHFGQLLLRLEAIWVCSDHCGESSPAAFHSSPSFLRNTSESSDQMSSKTCPQSEFKRSLCTDLAISASLIYLTTSWTSSILSRATHRKKEAILSHKLRILTRSMSAKKSWWPRSTYLRPIFWARTTSSTDWSKTKTLKINGWSFLNLKSKPFSKRLSDINNQIDNFS